MRRILVVLALIASVLAGTAAPAQAQSTNLALGQPATQSSTYFGAGADRAVDGNTSGSFWSGSVSRTSSESEPWWQVDLGAETTVADVVLYNRSGSGSDQLANFYIFVSDTDLTGRSLSDIVADSSVSRVRRVEQVGDQATIGVFASGRYVRIQKIDSGTLALAEVEIPEPTIFVSNPGDQRSAVGEAINVPISWLGNLEVVGLPGGLTFADGAISGAPLGTGSWPVELRVSDDNGNSDIAYFTWIVTDGPPPGEVAEHPPVDPRTVSERPMEGMDGVVWNRSHADTTSSLDVTVWDMQQLGDYMYVGGEFEEVIEQGPNGSDGQTHDQAHLARFSITTGEWDPTFRPVLDGNVHALEVSPRGLLLVGGEFTNIDGLPNTEALAAFNPNTSQVDPSFEAWVERPWYPEGRAIVRELEVVGDYLYVGGNFSHINGAGGQRLRVNKLARVGANYGTIDASWVPVVSGGSVWGIGIDQDRGHVLIAGRFTSVNGQTVDATATITTETGEIVSLPESPRNNTARTEQYDVEYAGNAVWEAGSQHVLQLLDPDTRELLAWNVTGNRCTSTYCWSSAGVGGDFQFVEKIGDYVFAGCHCNEQYNSVGPNHYSTVAGVSTTHSVAMAYNLDGGIVTEVEFDLGGNIDGGWTAATDDRGCIWLGGDIVDGGFYEPGGRVFARGFARFCDTQVYTPENLQVTVAARDNVRIEWNAVPNAGGYLVYRDGAYLGFATEAFYIDDTASEGVTYSYQVSAENLFGVEGPLSEPVEVTVGEADTEPPSVPQNLTIVNDTDTSVEFSWEASTDNSAVSGYLVYRDGAYLGFVPEGQTSYLDQGLALFDTHDYTVRAVDAADNRSDQSDPLTVTIGGADTEPPSVPENLTTISVTDTAVEFSWDASTDNAGVFNYLVYRDGIYIGWSPAATTTFVDDNVVPFSTYSYTVRAVDGADNRSDLSAPLEVSVGGDDVEPPTVPENLSAEVDGSTVDLSWDPSVDNAAVMSYLVYRDGSYIGWTPAAQTSFTDPNAVLFATHSYTVRAVDVNQNRSERSLPLDVAVGGADVEAPSVPVGLVATNVTDSSVEFEWTPSTDNAGVFNYLIYRDGAYAGWTPAASPSFVDSGLAPFSTYSYTVRAVDVNGNRSERSLPLDVVVGGVDTEVPTVPVNLVATNVTASSVEFVWDPSTDNAGINSYLVYRDGAYIGWTPAGQTAYTDTTVLPGTTYNYTVRAVDVNSLRSEQSLPLQVITG